MILTEYTWDDSDSVFFAHHCGMTKTAQLTLQQNHSCPTLYIWIVKKWTDIIFGFRNQREVDLMIHICCFFNSYDLVQVATWVVKTTMKWMQKIPMQFMKFICTVWNMEFGV
jgi:hypothetical protein